MMSVLPSPNSFSMIRLDAVTKRYDETDAVREVSLTAEAEATTVLIGPSGSGKSTLLRLIIGLTQPDAGTVTVNGQQLTPANVRSLRRRMGYVIQKGGLFPHLTGRDNAALMAHHLGWPQDRIDESSSPDQCSPRSAQSGPPRSRDRDRH